MEPIDGITRAMQLLRRRLSEPSARAPVQPGADPRPATELGPRSSAEDLRASVVTRLKALDVDDARYAEHATEAFVEGVLLAEFGPDMINDPQFRQLIRGVAVEMRTEPQVAEELEQLFLTLRAE